MLIPTGFWSYTTSDDTSSRGKLSQLRALLAGELQQQIGREPKVNIFQDVAAIPPGAEWERQIRESIDTASFIIPIVTPGFLQSEWCCQEVTLFREREQKLGVRDLVFPIHYVDTEHLDGGGDREVLRFLRTRQWIDFRHLRFKSLESEDVALLLETLSRGILKALRGAWLVQQRAEAERGREAAAREAEAVEARQQEAAARQAEEARRREAAAADTMRLDAASNATALSDAAETAKVDETRQAPEVAERLGLDGKGAHAHDDAVDDVRASGDGSQQEAEAPTASEASAEQLEKTSKASPSAAATIAPKRSGFAGRRAITIGGLILVAILLIGGVLSGAFATDPVREAADRGDAHAMYILGRRYDFGEGVWWRDYAKARAWYEKAAAAGNADAMNRLGELDEFGDGRPQDYAEARQWFEKAAAAGSAQAMDNLGSLYEEGNGVPRSTTQARQWYEKAAASGDTYGMWELGRLYEHGIGVPQDYAKACQWYSKVPGSGGAETATKVAAWREKGLCTR